MRPDRRLGLTLVDVVVLVVVLAVVATVTAPALLHRARRRSGDAGSLNNLRRIAAASLSYADERRGRFPHVASFTNVDGAYDSDTAPRCLRALTYFGHVDDPSVFVDASSNDRPAAAPVASRSFSWDPERVEACPDSPLKTAGLTDRPLTELSTLSYAWTREGLNANCRCDHVLAGDRARRLNGDEPGPGGHRGNMIGNHDDGFRVVFSDGRTKTIRPDDTSFSTRRPDAGAPPSLMGTTRHSDGFLGALADDE